MKPSHKRFFSSLKQVEKRLKLDDGKPPPPPPPPPTPPPPLLLPQPRAETQQTESFSSSPIYFHNQHTNTSSTLHDNSVEQPPQEFLSINDEFLSDPNQNPPQLNDSDNNFSKNSTVGDIDSMIQLLRLSDSDGKVPEMPDVVDDDFYDKIVKVKGPKCKKELERLDGWIKYLLNNGGIEPLRLAHLLLAKAAFVSAGNGGDSDGDRLEFPSTIDEFLHTDPLSD